LLRCGTAVEFVDDPFFAEELEFGADAIYPATGADVAARHRGTRFA